MIVWDFCEGYTVIFVLSSIIREVGKKCSTTGYNRFLGNMAPRLSQFDHKY